MKNKKKLVLGLGLLLFIAVMFSCAPGENELIKVANSQGELAGFLKGFWHGFILLFSFIISLFKFG